MKLYVPIAKRDDEQRMVYGYATTEALDAQGEVVTRAAIAAALPAYMQFANIREMHQLSAVGIAKGASLDEKGLHLEAKVVDDDAWAKVKEGVYKGFSIGGHITQRDGVNKTLITGVDLTEISLVDRPANPEALIDAYKAAGVSKVGARNSAADLERIQSMHDTAVELGANCPGHGAGDDDDAEDDGDDGAGNAAGDTDNDNTGDAGDDDTLQAVSRGARNDVLAKLAGRIEALTQKVEEQASLLQKLADEPAPPKYLTSRAVEKSADGVTAPVEAAPETPLDAIKKAHRNPIRLSLG